MLAPRAVQPHNERIRFPDLPTGVSGAAMAQDSAFEALMDRLRGGDEAAAAEVFRHFARRLIALAESRLSAQVRAKVDAEDILQSVFKSFFRRQAAGEFDLDSWDSLWSLLTVITLRKCGYHIRRWLAARRDVRHEAAPPAREGDSDANWQAISREPTPSEAAVLVETVAELLRGLDERDRQIVERSLQGESVGQISAGLGFSERTVLRVLQRVRKRLERLRVEDAAEA
jgi:RNA polymerase sigma-70 factor (ECF subfamily)